MNIISACRLAAILLGITSTAAMFAGISLKLDWVQSIAAVILCVSALLCIPVYLYAGGNGKLLPSGVSGAKGRTPTNRKERRDQQRQLKKDAKVRRRRGTK